MDDIQEHLAPPRCRLSDPVHPHTLSRRDNPPPSDCFKCGPGGATFDDGGSHYYCQICELVFHDLCYFSPQRIRHPYHLHHPLTFTLQFPGAKTQSYDNNLYEIKKSTVKIPSPDSTAVYNPDDPCDWCEKKLGLSFHRCLVCSFSLDSYCVEKDPPFTITNPKSHQHHLTFFPRPLLVPCSACGCGDKKEDPGYVCIPCNYLVHQSCIDLPRVIKLTRHPHRLSYTPCLPPPSKRSCGVCHTKVDVKYGMYTCNKGCSYAVHSKCATNEDIWDGIDLEDVPEEPIEDVAPFEEVGYNLIKHFSHKHHLRFDEDVQNHHHDADKECQACCKKVDSGGFYRCTMLHCEFFLHATCANFPKKKEHPVHKHPLILKPIHKYNRCSACRRVCSGFSYTCFNKSCNDDYVFQMDVVCASVCEPFEHKVHPHPLFLFSGSFCSSLCVICNRESINVYTLTCNDCEFSMCFRCATIPVVIRYKHDEHPLTLSGGEDSSCGPYWCEICEKQINSKKWFYTCNQCCTTLHVGCIFGDAIYTKIGYTCDVGGYEYTYVSNNGNSRPVCDQCYVRCQYPGFFKGKDAFICSFKCLYNFDMRFFLSFR